MLIIFTVILQESSALFPNLFSQKFFLPDYFSESVWTADFKDSSTDNILWVYFLFILPGFPISLTYFRKRAT